MMAAQAQASPMITERCNSMITESVPVPSAGWPHLPPYLRDLLSTYLTAGMRECIAEHDWLTAFQLPPHTRPT